MWLVEAQNECKTSEHVILDPENNLRRDKGKSILEECIDIKDSMRGVSISSERLRGVLSEDGSERRNPPGNIEPTLCFRFLCLGEPRIMGFEEGVDFIHYIVITADSIHCIFVIFVRLVNREGWTFQNQRVRD